MSHFVSPTAFERVTISLPPIETRSIPSCCQQAVEEAMENAASMGSIATLTMLMVGFTFGLATAWFLFG
jgi:hypothetical protein